MTPSSALLPHARVRHKDSAGARLPAIAKADTNQQQQQQQAEGAGVITSISLSSMRRTGGTRSRLHTTDSFSPGSRQQQQQQQQGHDYADEEPSAAQLRLQQLLGVDSSCLAALEAAAGARIRALPFAICRAADGSLFEVATGHVQLMMLRRHLASLGVELTPEDEAMLTTGVSDAGSASLCWQHCASRGPLQRGTPTPLPC
jgi:hypothetical protein